MYIVEVIPLASLPPQVPQLLSYFYDRELSKGSIVEASLNKRKIQAVVASSYPVEEQKMLLKKYGFQLKKLPGVINEEPILTDTQFKIALWLSRNCFSPLGISFKAVLPNFFGNPKFPFVYPKIETKREKPLKPTWMLLKSNKIINELNSEIRKVTNHKKQVLIIVPEISIAESFYNVIAGYYETTLLHSGITPKQNYKEWQKISSGETEVVIGTRQALFAPFLNLGLVIMEDPANEAYKSDMTPKYNTRDVVYKIAEYYNAELTYISQIPDIRAYVLSQNGRYELKEKRTIEKTDIKVENMVYELKSGNFSVFSRELKNNIDQYAKDNKKILIFSSRKGYYGSYICENCGFCFKCSQCSIPLRVFKFPEDSLICQRCFTSYKVPDSCSNCHSYKLKTAGFAGSERIKEELVNLQSVNGKEVFVLDLSTVKNKKEESELIKKMEESDSFICVATQAIFSHRYNFKFDLIGIPNLDGLTTIPDFKAEEGLFSQFEKLIDMEPERIILQTFNSDNKLIDYLTKRDYKQFYDNELQSRKLFFYPPFTRLVKLSFYSPNKSKAGYEARILSEKIKMAIFQGGFGGYVKMIGPAPAFIEREKNKYGYNITLKISPNFGMEQILRYVPSQWIIDVDPRSIL